MIAPDFPNGVTSEDVDAAMAEFAKIGRLNLTPAAYDMLMQMLAGAALHTLENHRGSEWVTEFIKGVRTSPERVALDYEQAAAQAKTLKARMH